MGKLELELLFKHSALSLILDHLTFGFLQKNADSHLLAISIDISIALRVLLMQPMEPNSILHMVQVLLLDLSDKILLMLQDAKLKKHYLVKLLD